MSEKKLYVSSYVGQSLYFQFILYSCFVYSIRQKTRLLCILSPTTLEFSYPEGMQEHHP